MKPAVNDVIPQRYPFEMIDKFIDVQPGVSASAIKLISINEWFFANQTSSRLAVPRPIMIEAMAQTGVAAILSIPENKGKNVFFGGIKNATFQDDFRPGGKLLSWKNWNGILAWVTGRFIVMANQFVKLI